MKMSRAHIFTKRAVAASAAVAFALTAAGCGANAPATEPTTGVAGPELAAFAEKAQAAVTVALATQVESVPTDSPTVVTGKSVVIVAPGGSSQEGAYRLSLAAQDAARALGWDITYINANTDVGQMNAAVQKAIAIGADGVITLSIDASVVQSALEQAYDAGIKLVGVAAANTDGETGIYDALVPNVGMGEADGYLMGQQAYVKTDGHIHAVDMSAQGYGYIDARERGWNRFIKDCQAVGGDCTIEQTATFSAGEIVASLPQLTASTVRSNPEWNVLWSGFDSGISFMEQGITQAGLKKEGAIAVGFDGNTPNLDEIRNAGFQVATMGLPTVCLGYAAVDNLNRLFAGAPLADGSKTGCESKLLDASNVPASGPWWGDLDLRPTYWENWGIEIPKNPSNVEDL